jgi:hypothetical protein
LLGHPTARRALRTRAAAGVAALVVGLSVTVTLQRARSLELAWGPTRPAVVAVRDLRAGEVLDDDDVVVRRLPPAVLARGVLVDPPIGRTLRTDVRAGEPLTDARLLDPDALGDSDGSDGPSAIVRVVTGQGSVVAPPLSTGDLVDVHGRDPGRPGLVGLVAADALVVDADGSHATLRIDRAAVPALAGALDAGAVVIARVG